MMNDYRNFIHQSRYARWLEEEGRRETWEETTERLQNAFNDKLASHNLTDEGVLHPALAQATKAIRAHEVMPSMRALMTAGTALNRDNVAGYNCSYLPIDSPYSFDEAMYILMCGTGVGFSVERQYVNKLPVVGNGFAYEEPDLPEGDIDRTYMSRNTIYVGDSKYGWAEAYRLLVHALYSGDFSIEWDVSAVRPAGAPLVQFGGRASGPQPLLDLFSFTKEVMYKAFQEERKLTSIEAHDIMCKVGEVVVVGGVRRSALISLSNLSDDRMRRAKSGEWWVSNGQRALANNSVCFTEKPDFHSFLKEWQSLYESKSGERGLFNRVASQRQAAVNGRRDSSYEFGTNPCSEIILRPYQFCNLTEVVVRSDDTFEDLRSKVQIASFLGTVQSCFTDFKYLRSIWKENTEEERLLGVSLTGIMDHPVLNSSAGWSDMATFDKDLDNHELFFHGDSFIEDRDEYLSRILVYLKEEAVETNKYWANQLGIPQSAAVTAVKPSGTVSQLVDSASGIHPRFSPFYIRRVRGDVKDPLSKFMIDRGIPWEEDAYNKQNVVFSFPQRAPEGAICTKDIGAMEQLKLWMTYQEHWCEHKPSITVYYTDDDFLEVGSFVYKNFDKISGVSFLPYEGHSYAQAPYEEIDSDKYEALLAELPSNIDWTRLGEFEKEDNTTSSQTLACSGGSCEIVDIGQKDE